MNKDNIILTKEERLEAYDKIFGDDEEYINSFLEDNNKDKIIKLTKKLKGLCIELNELQIDYNSTSDYYKSYLTDLLPSVENLIDDLESRIIHLSGKKE